MEVFAVPIFSDNYVWTLHADGRAAVVDPGDAEPVVAALAERGLVLDSILITHHHPDHIGGLAALKRRFDVPVYGPAAEAGTIRGLTRELRDGDAVTVLGQRFEVLAVPGHTLGHIAFHAPGILLCGDTLFSAGCGRLFEGTAEQMQHSLARLAALPPETRVYCTHEYTAANLRFAQAVEPGNASVAAYAATVQSLRARNEPTLPSTLGREAAVNPFLRWHDPAVIAAARAQGAADDSPVAVFGALRRWKDGFRG